MMRKDRKGGEEGGGRGGKREGRGEEGGEEVESAMLEITDT